MRLEKYSKIESTNIDYKEKVENNLGTIAKSGSLAFKEAQEKQDDVEISKSNYKFKI